MKLIASLICFGALVSCQYGSEKQEISIGGKSYFVDPYLAQEIGGLPAAQRWERIQRMESPMQMEQQGLQMERMQRMGSPMQMEQQGLKEVSIDGQSYFVNPVLSQQIGDLPAVQQMERIQRMGQYSSYEDSEDLKEVSIGGQSYFVNPVLSQQIGGLPAAQQMERIQRMGTPRMVRSMHAPTQNVYNQEFTQQRVLRTPISKTVTVLPNEVTRITRNIKTHMPMVHDRIRHHYNVENVNKKNIVHHYVHPVANKYLGTRTGRSAQLGTEHVVHRNRMFTPLRFATEQGGQVMGNGLADTGFNGMNGNSWKIQQAASCEGLAAGQHVMPVAICTCNGQMCDNDNCNDLPLPQEIVC